MKKKVYTRLLLLVLALVFTLIPASAFADANGFAGGDGSAENPYQITDKYELDNMRNYPDANFILMKDIVFEDEDFEEGGAFFNHEAIDYRWGWFTGYNNENHCDPLESGWVPILRFNGSFDGNDYAIENLRMTRYSHSISNYFGFIVENNGTIKNLHLQNLNFSTGSSLGNYVGGFAAMNNGTIKNCVASGTMELFATDCVVGGIAGENKGTISNCINLSNAYIRPFCPNANVGGIVSCNLQDGIVENCVNFGNLGHGLSESTAASGICANNQGEIVGCYAFGNFSYPKSLKIELDDINGQDVYSGGIRYGICKKNTGVIKQSYACGQDIDELIGNEGNNSNIGEIINCSYIALEDAYNKSSYPGFDFQNVWTTNQLGLPYPGENTIFSSLNLDFSQIKKEISNVSAQPNSYKSIAITWNKNETCAKYHLYLLTEEMDSYVYGTIPSNENKCIYKILAVIDGNQNKYIHQVAANDKKKYLYAVAPVWDVGGVLIEGVCSPITSSYVVDTNGILDTPEDTVSPVVQSMNLLTEETYPPGEVKIRLKASDNSSGIREVKLEFATEDKAQFFILEKSFAEKTVLEGDLSFSVDSNIPYGNYTLRYIKIYDKEGNEHQYTGAYFDSPELSVSKEFDIEFTGVLSSKYVANELTNMEAGKTVVLTIDEKSGGVLKKEILDAIKGQDKTVVVYADDQGSMQWVFYGKDITGTTKDLDLNVKVKKVDGSDYGGKGSIIHLTYGNNGKLPGLINFRLKSDYINAINGLDDELYLYHLSGKKVNLESSSCQVIKDGSSHWCYFDLEHNSEFLLSGQKLKHPLEKQTAKLSYTSTTYSGSAKKPTVTINGLKKDTDYTVSYKNNTNAGKATVTIKGKGNYAGTITKTFTIKPKKITAASLGATSYDYNGEAKKPAVTVKSGDKVLMKAKKADNASVDLTYAAGRKNPGTYKVTIKGKGNYTGTITKKFTVKVKNTTLKSVTKGKKQFTVTWKKVPAANITGYQIRYSTTKNFAKYTDVKIKKNTTVSKTVKVKKGGQKYWVKVRTYKTIGNKPYYSAWSEAKTVTPKK